MPRYTWAPLALILTLGLIATAAADPADLDGIEQIDVFTSGADGYHTYRIPAIVVTKQGTLLAFCEGRKSDRRDHGDIDLVLRRSEDLGRTWGPMRIVHEEGGDAKVTIGNPCAVVDRETGTVWLAFCRDNDQVLITRSVDDGHTWAEPVDLTEQCKQPEWRWYATGPGHGIQLERGPQAGRLIVPCNHGNIGKKECWSHVIYSDDHGETWSLGGSLPDPRTSEPEVVELVDGRLMMNTRNWPPTEAFRRAVSISDDGGTSWSATRHDPALITPHCQGSIIRYTTAPPRDANRILFSNPADTKNRVRMTVRLSLDEGQTWAAEKLIHAGPSAYSCLTVLPEMSIGLLYERGAQHAYETITLARFRLAWLTD